MRAAILQILFGYMPFSPRLLFLAGQQGAWYDPSDFSTMFQDAAGTIPVTSVGQPVGLLLDKSGRGNHASQTTTTSRPILRQDEAGRYYLEFDGTDDWLQTASIDFSGTDKMSVFAGVRKLNDTLGYLVELSANSVGNAGTFTMLAPQGVSASNYSYGSRGSSSVRTAFSSAIYPPPITNILSGLSDIGSDICLLRINGAQVGSTSLDQGTGNYGSYPLYIGRRGGASFAFNGRLYSLIIRGAMTASQQLEQTERWVAAKTGVSL